LTTQGGRKLQPEDNWELTGNPSVYLDQLPQPYRFINSCLDLLVLRPVFNQITLIEEKKKTTEYEGFLKELQATGFVDHADGITALAQIRPIVLGAGGKMTEKDSGIGGLVENKVLLGDKHGFLQLFDASRKLMLDRK
jgi:hypothetical protein